MKCFNCKKDIGIEQSYRCRMCHDVFCSDCSLKHFGLQDEGERVYHKDIVKSFFWNLRKKFFRKD